MLKYLGGVMENKNHIIIINGSPRRSKTVAK